MSKACGVNGSLHNKSDKTLLTPGGEVSTMRTIYPTDSECSIFEKEVGSGKGKTTLPINKNIKEAVRDFVIATTNEALAKENKNDCAAALRAYVVPIRDKNAYSGDYQKTYRVAGIVAKSGIQYAASVAQQDRVSLPSKDADIDALKKITGEKFFDDHFSKNVKISIKKSVIENKELMKELSKLLVEKLGVDGIKKFFVKEEVWSVKEGFDKGQYELDDTTRKQMLEAITVWSDAVADASFDPKNVQ